MGIVTSTACYAVDSPSIDYDQHIASILKKHCLQCHGESKKEAGLDLSSYESILKGGSGGVIVVPGRSSTSRIIQAITAENPDERMPPDNDPLPADQIATLQSWIDKGLKRDSQSKEMSTNSIGFKPQAAVDVEKPAAMPADLPAFEKPNTIREFPILSIAASPRSPLVAVSSYESIDLYDSSNQKIIGTLGFPEGEPHVLRLSRSGNTLLAAGGRPVQNGVAVLFDVASGKRVASIGDELDEIIAADISPDEKQIAVGGSNKSIKVFSTETGKLQYTLVKHTEWITAIAYSPDGKLLATGDRIGNIHLWDANSGGVVLPLSEHKSSIRSLSWRTDSAILASASEDGSIHWWDINKGWPVISKANAHPPARQPNQYGKIQNGVLDVSFGNQGELVTCGRDKSVKLWSGDGQELKSLRLPEPEPSPTAQSPRTNNRPNFPTRSAITFDNQWIITGDSSGKLHWWPTDIKK